MRKTGMGLARGAAAALFAAVLLVPAAWAQDESPLDSILIDGHLHTPGEVFRLLDRSTVKYVIGLLSDSEVQAMQKPPTVLGPGLRPMLVDGKMQCVSPHANDSANKLFDHAEYLYAQKEYEEARDWYRRAMAADSDLTDPIVLIGDCFYSERDLDSAVFYFSQGVEDNPTNYQARYFLADALWELGDTTASMEALLFAHLLNVNHEDIYYELKRRRYALGEPWKEWSFNPICSLAQTDDGVQVRTTAPFVGYAMAKALWGYEPGYADKMRDSADLTEKFLHLKEEKEATACAFMFYDSLKTAVLDRIDLEDFSNFVLYEVIARKHPELMLLLTPESLDQVAEYVDRYH